MTTSGATRCKQPVLSSFDARPALSPELCMSKETPNWLPQVREFCRDTKINIMGWGSLALVVEAKSADAAARISDQLKQFGFKAVEDEADAYAGILTLSLKQ
jgi:hypothetical protein